MNRLMAALLALVAVLMATLPAAVAVIGVAEPNWANGLVASGPINGVRWLAGALLWIQPSVLVTLIAGGVVIGVGRRGQQPVNDLRPLTEINWPS